MIFNPSGLVYVCLFNLYTIVPLKPEFLGDIIFTKQQNPHTEEEDEEGDKADSHLHGNSPATGCMLAANQNHPRPSSLVQSVGAAVVRLGPVKVNVD